MRALIDTNILLDFLLSRKPYDKYADAIVVACGNGDFSGCIAAHSISNMFYILRKDYDTAERKKLLKGICDIFYVEGIDKAVIIGALDDDKFQDFEDCLQEKCAINFGADYIITRNGTDFENGLIPWIDPGEFCKLIKACN